MDLRARKKIWVYLSLLFKDAVETEVLVVLVRCGLRLIDRCGVILTVENRNTVEKKKRV